jgi:hypothetical protein
MVTKKLDRFSVEGHYNVGRTGIYLYNMSHITKTSPPTELTLSKSLNCYPIASHLLRGRYLDITNTGYTLPPLTQVMFLKTVNHEGQKAIKLLLSLKAHMDLK